MILDLPLQISLHYYKNAQKSIENFSELMQSFGPNSLPARIFRNVWLRFGLHVVLLTGLILVGQRQWDNFIQRQEIDRILAENKAIAASNSILKLQKDFYQSDFYAEKAAKESQWKKIGEEVIDMNDLGSQDNDTQGNSAINPSKPAAEESANNPSKWFRYLLIDSTKSQD